mgnify:CR=1 FL=1
MANIEQLHPTLLSVDPVTHKDLETGLLIAISFLNLEASFPPM